MDQAFHDDPWKEVVKKYQIGQTVNGKVLKTSDFGAFVELDKDIHGLAHISELADYPIKNAGEVLKIGDSYDFKIVSIEPNEHRLGLSLKAFKQKEKTDKATDQSAETTAEKEPIPVVAEKKDKQVKEKTTTKPEKKSAK